MGIGGAELDRLRYGALLHDVGKIGIPGEILRKPGPLSAEERERMDEHTAIGARMLERIPFLAPVAPLVRSAHERFDGGGYPDGLAGERDPPRGDDHRHLRRLPRDDLQPHLPPGDAAATRPIARAAKPTPAPSSTPPSSRRWSPSCG